MKTLLSILLLALQLTAAIADDNTRNQDITRRRIICDTIYSRNGRYIVFADSIMFPDGTKMATAPQIVEMPDSTWRVVNVSDTLIIKNGGYITLVGNNTVKATNSVLFTAGSGLVLSDNLLKTRTGTYASDIDDWHTNGVTFDNLTGIYTLSSALAYLIYKYRITDYVTTGMEDSLFFSLNVLSLSGGSIKVLNCTTPGHGCGNANTFYEITTTGVHTFSLAVLPAPSSGISVFSLATAATFKDLEIRTKRNAVIRTADDISMEGFKIPMKSVEVEWNDFLNVYDTGKVAGMVPAPDLSLYTAKSDTDTYNASKAYARQAAGAVDLQSVLDAGSEADVDAALRITNTTSKIRLKSDTDSNNIIGKYSSLLGHNSVFMGWLDGVNNYGLYAADAGAYWNWNLGGSIQFSCPTNDEIIFQTPNRGFAFEAPTTFTDKIASSFSRMTTNYLDLNNNNAIEFGGDFVSKGSVNIHPQAGYDDSGLLLYDASGNPQLTFEYASYQNFTQISDNAGELRISGAKTNIKSLLDYSAIQTSNGIPQEYFWTSEYPDLGVPHYTAISDLPTLTVTGSSSGMDNYDYIGYRSGIGGGFEKTKSLWYVQDYGAGQQWIYPNNSILSDAYGVKAYSFLGSYNDFKLYSTYPPGYQPYEVDTIRLESSYPIKIGNQSKNMVVDYNGVNFNTDVNLDVINVDLSTSLTDNASTNIYLCDTTFYGGAVIKYQATRNGKRELGEIKVLHSDGLIYDSGKLNVIGSNVGLSIIGTIAGACEMYLSCTLTSTGSNGSFKYVITKFTK